MLCDKFKRCTATKLRHVFDKNSGLRLFGASYRFYSDLFSDMIQVDSHVQFEDTGKYLLFKLVFLNRKDLDLYTLIDQGQEPKYNLIGDVPDMDLEEEPQMDTNIAHVEVKFSIGSFLDRETTVEYKTFKTNGRTFTLLHIYEQTTLYEDNPFHELYLLFGEKEKLNLLHAIGVNQKLNKQTTMLLFELFSNNIRGRIAGGAIEGVFYACDEVEGSKSEWSCIFSYYPTHSDISLSSIVDESLLISTDTGTMVIDYCKLRNITFLSLIHI